MDERVHHRAPHRVVYWSCDTPHHEGEEFAPADHLQCRDRLRFEIETDQETGPRFFDRSLKCYWAGSVPHREEASAKYVSDDPGLKLINEELRLQPHQDVGSASIRDLVSYSSATVRPTERGRGTAWNNGRWIGGRSNTGFVAFGKEETGTSSATNSDSSTRSMTNRNAGDFPENKDINQADCEDNKLTFAEYEKSIQEKKKEATEALKTEKRKVTAENQFEGMNLIGKKKEDDLHANMQKSGRNKGKKRDGFEKEEKMIY